MSGLLDLSKIRNAITDELKALNDPARKKKKVPRRTSGQVQSSVPVRKQVPKTTASKPAAPTKVVEPKPVQKDMVDIVPNEIVAESPIIPDMTHALPELSGEELTGQYMQVRLDRSFTARLILSDGDLQSYYKRIKQAFYAYAGVHSHISWRTELFRQGKNRLGILQIRGKQLYLYLALNPDEITDEKFKGEPTGDVKAFEGMPYCYQIGGDRKCTWAEELVAMVCEKAGLKKGKARTIDFETLLAPQTETELIDHMLIKEVVYLLQEPPKGWAHASVIGDTISMKGIHMYRTDVVFRRYGSVSLAQLEESFEAGDEVTLSALMQKGLVPPESDSWRVTGSEGLTKPLHIVTNYCTQTAASVIVNAGGSLKIYKSSSKF